MTAIPLEPAYREAAGLPVRALRLFLLLGVLVDVTGAVAMRFLPRLLADWLGVPAPIDNDFWPRYSAVFLVVVPMFYLIAALDPARYLGNVGGAIVARFLGFTFYMRYFLHQPDAPQAFLWLAIMNLLFVGVYSWLLRRVGLSGLLASVRHAHGSP
jgi:hypothetical protein